MNTENHLIIEQQGALGMITLDRVPSLNALSLQMINSIRSQVENWQNEDSIQAILIKSNSPKAFCAGGDIRYLYDSYKNGTEDHKGYFSAEYDMLNSIRASKKPVVVLLDGYVLGGGFGLACVSDIAISLTDAKFGLPETGLGVIPAQIAPFVVKRIGLTQARRLALLGNRFDGQTALKVGVVHEVVNSEDALNAVLSETIQQIKRAAPQASRVTKALLHRTLNEPLNSLLDDAAQQFANAVGGEEGMEGTMAFIQKRNPNWFDGG